VSKQIETTRSTRAQAKERGKSSRNAEKKKEKQANGGEGEDRS
jgi:hypothetical protein